MSAYLSLRYVTALYPVHMADTDLGPPKLDRFEVAEVASSHVIDTLGGTRLLVVVSHE